MDELINYLPEDYRSLASNLGNLDKYGLELALIAYELRKIREALEDKKI